MKSACGQGELAGGLDGVDEELAAVRGDELGDGGEGLDDAGFVVGVLHGDERRAFGERGGEGVEVEQAVGVDGQDLDVVAGGEHGAVLGGAGEDAPCTAAVERQRQRLGAAAGEDEALGVSAGPARQLHRAPPPEPHSRRGRRCAPRTGCR